MDYDHFCLQPMDELAYRYSFFSGIEGPMDYAPVPLTSAALVGSSKGHPIIQKLREEWIGYATDFGIRKRLNQRFSVQDYDEVDEEKHDWWKA